MIARVRRAFHAQGWSMKKISRELHVSRNTVRKILRSGETDFTYEREHQPLPKIGPWVEHVGQFLRSNEGKASRERLTLIAFMRRLAPLAMTAVSMLFNAMPRPRRRPADRLPQQISDLLETGRHLNPHNAGSGTNIPPFSSSSMNLA